MPKSRISNTLSGATWFEGTGAPGPSTGHKTCFYLDTATGEVYEKITATTWTLRGDITSPTVTGTWYNGSGAPAASLGLVGDYYEDTDTNGLVYRKTAPLTWVESLTGKLKTNQVDVANGVCPLDAGAKVPSANLPASLVGALVYQGGWDASGGTYPPGPSQGQYWVITVAGTLGGTPVLPGDWIVYNGTSWDIIDHQDVNGTWLSGSGAPTGTLGGVGDYYEDTSPTGYIYRKTGPTTWTAAWSKVSGISSTWEVYTGPKVLSGTYESNVKVNGNASISASVVVKGTLWVTGNLTQTAIGALEVWGDLIVEKECNLTPSDNAELSDVTIKGRAVLNTFQYSADNQSTCDIVDNGTYLTLLDWSASSAPANGDIITIQTGLYAGVSGVVSNAYYPPTSFDVTPVSYTPLGNQYGQKYSGSFLGTHAAWYSTYFQSKTTKATFSVGGDLTVFNFYGNPRSTLVAPTTQVGCDLFVGGDIYSPEDSIINDVYTTNSPTSYFPTINLSAVNNVTTPGGDGGDIIVKGVLRGHNLDLSGADSSGTARGGDTGSAELGGFDSRVLYANETIGRIVLAGGNASDLTARAGNVRPFACHGDLYAWAFMAYGGSSSANGDGGNIAAQYFGNVRVAVLSIYSGSSVGSGRGGSIEDVAIRGDHKGELSFRVGGSGSNYRGSLKKLNFYGTVIGNFLAEIRNAPAGWDPGIVENPINFWGNFIGNFDFWHSQCSGAAPVDNTTVNFYADATVNYLRGRPYGNSTSTAASVFNFNFYGKLTAKNDLGISAQAAYTSSGNSTFNFKAGCDIDSITNSVNLAMKVYFNGHCTLRTMINATYIEMRSKGCTLRINRVYSGTPQLIDAGGALSTSLYHTKIYVGADDITNAGKWTEISSAASAISGVQTVATDKQPRLNPWFWAKPSFWNWNVKTSPNVYANNGTNYQWTCSAWSPKLRFIIALSATSDQLMRSNDGGASWSNWTTTYTGYAWSGIAWGDKAGRFVAVSSTSAPNNSMYSSDGTSWSAASTGAWNAICYSSELSLFVAVGGSGFRAGYTTNGSSWSNASGVSDGTWRSVCWSKKLGMFVAVGDGGSSRIMTSTNGTSWTLISALSSASLIAVCWSEDLGIFVAISNTAVYTSPDGTTWTTVASPPSDGAFTGIIWCPEIGNFLITRNTIVPNYTSCYWSPNGTDWFWNTTSNNLPQAAWKAPLWLPEYGYALLLCQGATDMAFSSPAYDFRSSSQSLWLRGGGANEYVEEQGRENFIINGAVESIPNGRGFNIVTATGGWITDRWCIVHNCTTAQGFAQAGVGFKSISANNLRLTMTTRGTGVQCLLWQPFESSMVRNLAGRTITISLKIAASNFLPVPNNKSVKICLFWGTGTDQKSPTGGSVMVESIDSTVLNTTDFAPSLVSATFVVPNAATSLAVAIGMYGSNSYDQWQDGCQIRISEVMLNIGRRPAPFSRHGGTLESEIDACNRYYERNSSSGTTVYDWFSFFCTVGGQTVYKTTSYKVPKRIKANPQNNGTQIMGGASIVSLTPGGNYDFNENQFTWSIQTGGGGSIGVGLSWYVDAELT